MSSVPANIGFLNCNLAQGIAIYVEAFEREFSIVITHTVVDAKSQKTFPNQWLRFVVIEWSSFKGPKESRVILETEDYSDIIRLLSKPPDLPFSRD